MEYGFKLVDLQRRFLALLISAFVLLGAGMATAQVKGTVTEGNINPLRIAVPAFVAGGGPQDAPRGLPCYRHIGIYAYRAGFLKKYASLSHKE